MFIAVLLIVFAAIVVAFGGRFPDAEQLYYDADFTELYDAKDDTGREFKGGEAYDASSAEKAAARRGRAKAAAATADDRSQATAKDPAQVAQEIYDKVDI